MDETQTINSYAVREAESMLAEDRRNPPLSRRPYFVKGATFVMGLITLPMLLAALCSLLLSSCGGINVMGRKIPDREYKAGYDSSISREKLGLKPEGAHDEHGRVPPWDEFWNSYMGGHGTGEGSTAQSRRLHRYIVRERRKAGLPELSAREE